MDYHGTGPTGHVADMVIDFKRSRGCSLPTFNIQYVSASNSSSSYRSNKPPTKSIQQSSTHDQINPNVGIAKGITSKRTVPQPLNMVPPKYKTTKEKQCKFKKNLLQKISG